MKKRFYFKCFFVLFLLFQYFNSSSLNLRAVDSIKTLLKSGQNDTVKVSALINLSKLYQDSNSEKALEYGLQAFTSATKLNYPKSIGKALNNLGDLYWYKSDYGSSAKHYFEALKIFETFNDKPAIADCYRNIGWIYFYQKNYSAALSNYKNALKANQELGKKEEMVSNYTDIGGVYNSQKKYGEAIESFKNALKTLEDTGEKQNTAGIYVNMSETYDLMGELPLAIECCEKAVKIVEKIRHKRYMAFSYFTLGRLYTKAGRYNDAIVPLQKAIKNASDINDKEIMVDIYETFSKLYEKQNNFQKAYENTQLASALKDSVYNENNSRQANEMTTKYESDKKELLINNLKKDEEHEKRFRIYLIILCVFMASFAFVLFRGNNQKRKTNIALSSAYIEIEEKNKDITDSINYSKRIQDASLPPKELKYRLYPDAFVLFKPKDIVSGDFYWFTEKNGKKLIASCDCTGHGVPGALMSMIGNNILNQIVNEKEITSPDEVLNLLHKEIRKALKQDDHGETKDGMDIALITFTNENEIEYAGANRPLWVIRSAPTESKNLGKGTFLEEIKADKFSIGGAQSETERKFTNHKISLSKGDAVYIFSDGYADQFGGEEGKKFMSRKFKELLLANSKLPMLQQEAVLVSAMETWMGSREQVDDILVIGVRI